MDITQATSVIVTRKAAREQIEQALHNLAELQSILGKKKFQRRVKKAGKLFTDGLPKSVAKKKQKAKKAVEDAV